MSICKHVNNLYIFTSLRLTIKTYQHIRARVLQIYLVLEPILLPVILQDNQSNYEHNTDVGVPQKLY